ncbi:MAG: hypothetical protein K2H24_04985 [Clostridia bacterium]|nr:hypothetical protein [Clostridia bacterium]MDE6210718.1 hypothetical protein [Clostridia bacterium]MDE6604730.1 hypothetical protein [Clostridia bacterium]MDE6869310.1 hypothetical protein [Clostridia bacterium]
MKTCPKCNSQIDEDMALCPTCGERLRTFCDKNKYDKHNVLLVRFLMIISVLFPPIGAIVGTVIKKRHTVLGKLCFRYALMGLAIYCMLTLLALICYLAMTFLGISYL